MPVVKSLVMAIGILGCAFVEHGNAQTLTANQVTGECAAYSQADMRDCLTKGVTDSMAALKAAMGGVAKAIRDWDEDSKYRSEAAAKLAKSNLEFERFREAHCQFSVALGGGAIGNASKNRRLSCVIELNAVRISQLQELIASLPKKL